MSNWPILSLTTFFPLVGVVLIMILRGESKAKNARAIALWTSLITFALSLCALAQFDPGNPDFQLIEQVEWMPAFHIAYIKGVDGISIWFVLASTLLTPICVLSAWESVEKRVGEFMIALLVLEVMLVGMFTALDFVLFYLFFEGVLLPMFLLIGVWGGPGRVYAAFKFFLYTFVGSVLMLVAILAMYAHVGTMDMRVMLDTPWPAAMQTWLWIGFFASFAVKTPAWPVHTWLPFAHVEAPTAGSVMLAGVMLKMGGYGLIRINVQMLPAGSHEFANFVFVLSIVAIIYTSLVALAQTDMKKLIAYSSVAHMGFVTLGIFSVTRQGLDGAMYQMLSHAIVSGALFLCVGVVYDRLHTREIARYGGAVTNMPRYAIVFFVFLLGSVGLPGTSGFVGEFLAMLGAFRVNTLVAFLAATGVILGAAYMLVLYRRIFYGKLVKPDVMAMGDLKFREIAMFAPLVALVVWMGVYPTTFQSYYAASLDRIVATNAAQLKQIGLLPLDQQKQQKKEAAVHATAEQGN